MRLEGYLMCACSGADASCTRQERICTDRTCRALRARTHMHTHTHTRTRTHNVCCLSHRQVERGGCDVRVDAYERAADRGSRQRGRFGGGGGRAVGAGARNDRALRGRGRVAPRVLLQYGDPRVRRSAAARGCAGRAQADGRAAGTPQLNYLQRCAFRAGASRHVATGG
eukprot:3846812-Pleurochrysis_carterae.AAC.4